ncbi:hypothetical protein KAFR_0G02100 [Kazachstania africana CBS 2517]|uniref:Peroxisomal membrane protein PEX25 n=1 Tax=Kazachstania africana (strain ATCC 22294 / BCRC 22015 / CBS 2517 / CECT 1963 / NBRC 1671 / NRRL Y-8276) TaxID=1071382 RepID=H2AXZ4_KAZAF|nr:hypothetical protein KAFR_0G02100 [Kazachstania africana CBS 2517]CCF59244.1 hypothetical protein KAFR_0G02100 [Kazachstania africana CBS 2517]
MDSYGTGNYQYHNTYHNISGDSDNFVEELKILSPRKDESNNNNNSNNVTIPNVKDMTKITVTNLEILQYLLNSLSGKDKFAKIVKYTLDLIILFIEKESKPKSYISKSNVNNIVMNLLVNKPRLLIIFFLQKFVKTLSYISSQLSTYRYILRFGNSPFLTWDFIKAIKKLYTNRKHLSLQSINETFKINDLINLYYTICDELVLLHKFKVWSNPYFYERISRHQVLSWQYDIVLSLINNLSQLNTNQQKEFELNLLIKIKREAINFQISNNNKLFYNDTIDIYAQLNDLKRQKKVIHLEISKLIFDFMANSIDFFKVYDAKIIPKGTYGVLSLVSGLIGFYKLWINAKDDIYSSKQKSE